MLGMETKSPHDMRRTFATSLFYSGMSVKSISAMMGHASLTQTEAYIKYKKDVSEMAYLEAII